MASRMFGLWTVILGIFGLILDVAQFWNRVSEILF